MRRFLLGRFKNHVRLIDRYPIVTIQRRNTGGTEADADQTVYADTGNVLPENLEEKHEFIRQELIERIVSDVQ